MDSRAVADVDLVRRLDGVEAQTWRVIGAVLVRLPAALDAQLHRDAGMSWFEYQILAALAGAPDGSRRLTELAEAADASLSKLSRAIDRLERRGWMERRTDPADGRYTRGVLTAAGRDQLALAMPGHVEELRRLVFDALGEGEAARLGELGARVLAALEAVVAVPPPRTVTRRS